MTADSVLIKAQRAALALMVDTCTITRLVSTSTNPETGQVTNFYNTIYTGVCRIQQRSILARAFNVAEAEQYMVRLELHLPVTATGVNADDVVTMLTSLHDADLVGRRFSARVLGHKTYESARRFELIEVLS